MDVSDRNRPESLIVRIISVFKLVGLIINTLFERFECTKVATGVDDEKLCSRNLLEFMHLQAGKRAGERAVGRAVGRASRQATGWQTDRQEGRHAGMQVG